jgi:hypothetical protein
VAAEQLVANPQHFKTGESPMSNIENASNWSTIQSKRADLTAAQQAHGAQSPEAKKIAEEYWAEVDKAEEELRER